MMRGALRSPRPVGGDYWQGSAGRGVGQGTSGDAALGRLCAAPHPVLGGRSAAFGVETAKWHIFMRALGVPAAPVPPLPPFMDWPSRRGFS